MTEEQHFAVNAWMLEQGFIWIPRAHPDGGLWTYFDPAVGLIQLTQAAAGFALYQRVIGSRQKALEPPTSLRRRLVRLAMRVFGARRGRSTLTLYETPERGMELAAQLERNFFK